MTIAERIEVIKEKIEKAALRSGRKPGEVQLMGVSKFHTTEKIEEAIRAGLMFFGESRVQEAVLKYKGFKEEHPDTELHFIGPLQRNKVKAAVPFFDCVQSVDRESLAAEMAKYAAERVGLFSAAPFPVLLEFRTGEDSKGGFTSLDDLFRTVELILGCRANGFPSLNIRGLMTIAPNTGDEGLIRAAFRKLMKIRQELQQRVPCGISLSCLSMGMSGDFEIAVEEGSTMLRIGTAIFGDV